MSKAEDGRHEAVVLTLERRLQQKHYPEIHRHVHYKVVGKYTTTQGELDVLAVRGSSFHYYEVKSFDSVGAWCRAREQFERLHALFPQKDIKFVYVTPQRVVRYRPKSI